MKKQNTAFNFLDARLGVAADEDGQSKITKYAKQSQFPGRQMNLSVDNIRCYENTGLEKQSQNKPKTKPIQTQSKPIQTQSKPIQTQSKPILSRRPVHRSFSEGGSLGYEPISSSLFAIFRAASLRAAAAQFVFICSSLSWSFNNCSSSSHSH